MVLFLKVVDVAAEGLRTNLEDIVLAIGFSEVTGDESFCSVGVDVHEVSAHKVAVADHHCKGQKAHIVCSGLKKNQSDQNRKSHDKYLRGQTIEANTGVITCEKVSLLADGLTLSSSIAVRNPA